MGSRRGTAGGYTRRRGWSARCSYLAAHADNTVLRAGGASGGGQAGSADGRVQLISKVVDELDEDRAPLVAGLGAPPPLGGVVARRGVAQYDGRTLYFPKRSTEVALAPFLGSLPPGYTLVSRDEQLFARSFDAADTLATFGSLEQVLRHTRGVMIFHGDHVVCEAATGAIVEGRIEVGVTTDEQHRGQGLATAACAALIAACEAEGLVTWWDCATQNEASIRLARRLGFHAGREYRYLLWPQR